MAMAGKCKVPTVVRSATADVQVKGVGGACGGRGVGCGVRADGARARLWVEVS